MKIVDRKTFLALPAGTVFSKFQPCVFSDISIKGDTLSCVRDFYLQPIADAVKCDDSDEFGDILEDAMAHGTSFEMDFECEMRDGFFDESERYAVWGEHDVDALISRLQMANRQRRGEGR